MLRECRRVLRPGGRVAFLVIFVAPGLSASDRVRAIAAGPSSVAASSSYPDLLASTGFTEIDEVDLTDQYREAAAAWIRESAKAAKELEPLFGVEEFRSRQQDRRAAVTAIEDGLLKRALFAARVPF